MESESNRSELGSRSRRGRGIHNSVLNNNCGVPPLHHRAGDRSRHSHRSGSSHAKNKKPDMAPFQTTVNLDDNGREGQEIIEVQILPRTYTTTKAKENKAIIETKLSKLLLPKILMMHCYSIV